MVFVSKIARCLIELRAVKDFVRIIVRCLIKVESCKGVCWCNCKVSY